MRTLLGWIDREARQADSDKIRTFAMHAGFRRMLKRAGYFQVKSSVQFVAKVNGVDVAAVVLRRHRSLARDAGRFRPGSLNASARRHRHRRRQPVGRRRAREPAVREHLRASAPARAVRAARRPADLRHHAPGRDRSAIGRGPARGCSRGGDCEIGAHHHAWETPPCTPDDVRRHAYASTLPRQQFADAAGIAHRRRSPRAVGARPVSYRSGRFGFSADHVAALEERRLPGRIEHRAALLRGAQGRTGVRRGAADGRTFWRTTARRAGHEQPARGAGERGAEPAPAESRCSTPTRGRPGRTRPSACCEKLGLAAAALAAAVVFVAGGHDRAGARPRARRASRC